MSHNSIGVTNLAKKSYMDEAAAHLVEQVKKQAFRGDHEGVSFELSKRCNRVAFTASKDGRVFRIFEDYIEAYAGDEGRLTRDIIRAAKEKAAQIQAYAGA